MSSTMVSTYRVCFSAKDEADGQIIAESISDKIMDLLDEEDGDFVELTQTLPFSENTPVTPQEVCDQLRLARNILLRTRIKDFYDLARELDKAIFILKNRREETMDFSGYDWGKMVEIAAEVFKGKMPVD